MKILIINISDIRGGAARAAYRLHRSLLNQNVKSKMLVDYKYSDDFTVVPTSITPFQKSFTFLRSFVESLPVRFYKNRTPTLFSPSFVPFGKMISKINEMNPDIVHLHWVCGGAIRIEDFKKINSPIVWSLHDNWAFTGGCHIMWECQKYKDNCGACPRLESKKENDLSRKIYDRKQKTFSKIDNITIVGLSKWINECSKKSSLLKSKRHINLPNPIDTDTFKSFDKDKARELWNLPSSKNLVLFGANNATIDINKGFKELRQALHTLKDKNIELVVFGSSEPKESQNFGVKTHYLGRLHDDISLMTLYNAVDIIVVPSLQENLSNVIMESLACGRPVVGFDIGGNGDMIEHKETGYLAKPFDINDLTYGIEWILYTSNYDKLCHNARKKAKREFNSNVVAKKYIALYESILENV